jgi:hypothetical protein
MGVFDGCQRAGPKPKMKEKHLIERLGWAAVYQWDALPAEVQELLLDQAASVEVLPITVQLRQQLEIFVRKNKGSE